MALVAAGPVAGSSLAVAIVSASIIVVIICAAVVIIAAGVIGAARVAAVAIIFLCADIPAVFPCVAFLDLIWKQRWEAGAYGVNLRADLCKTC